LRALRASIPCWLEDAEKGLTDRFRRLLQGLWEDLQHLHSRFGALDRQLHELADTDPVAQRLQQLRGVGPLVGHSHGGHHWRWCSLPQGQTDAALGRTPRQHSSGDKQRLYGITKRGDAYLRTLLIHGTRAVVSQAKHREDRLSRWVTAIAKRHHTNVAAVALPNKTARIAWTMLRTGADYDPNLTAA